MKQVAFVFLSLVAGLYVRSQNVGINTPSPLAMLHVKDSNVLFTGPVSFVNYNPAAPPPVQGPGTRVMWYAQKGAFRAGWVEDDRWDKDSIGVFSMGLGHSVLASNTGAVSLGVRSSARGFTSTALGQNAEADGDYSIAAGFFSRATAQGAVSIGIQNQASGVFSVSLGLGNLSSGASSLSLGTYNKVSGVEGVAAGSTLRVKARSAFAAGWYNDTTDNPDPLFPAPDDRIFQVGNGSGFTATYSNALTILRNGNHGIGTFNPAARLHVADSNVVFTGGPWNLPAPPGNTPVLGGGVRMMWYPGKAAFRTGAVSSTAWDKDSIGKYSFAAGLDVLAKSDYTIALGVNNNSGNWYAFTAGAGNTALGVAGVGMGYNATARNTGSVAIGYDLVTKALYGVSIGSYNDTTDLQLPLGSGQGTDRVFQVGNGNGVARSNALTILRNGNTGLGTVNPAAHLQVTNGDVVFTGGAWNLPDPATDPAVSGNGVRLLWYPGKAAFRAGAVSGSNWDKDSIGNYSFAVGLDVKAKSLYSIAMGVNNTSDNWYAFTAGVGNTALGTSSIAMGSSALARNLGSVAIGYDLITKAVGAATFGSYNDTTDAQLPSGSSQQTDRIFQVGNGASGARKNALTILRSGNVGIGVLNPQFVMDIAGRIRLRSANSETTGLWLSNVSNTALPAFIGMAAENVVGFYGSGMPGWGLTMNTTNGNVGIGLNGALANRPLSFPAALGEKILLYPGVNGEVGIGVYGNELRLHCDNPGSKVSFGTQDNAGVFTELARAQSSGAFAFSVFGSLWVNGTTYASDMRFKDNITKLASPLERLLRIEGVEYTMRTKEFPQYHFPEGRQMGLLAQNVEQVVPEAVSEMNGYKAVDYARLVPLLVESIKEQQQQIEELKKEIRRLK